ncbi:MAG: T9SS type A sorting domain-containing protein [Ignavibacteriaceae bacterium]|nr:T9SS type A sorting domain-containing protein [Ignavibacteriaceae bacterium]
MVAGNWPNPGQNALVQISDGLDTVDMLIDRHTDISFNPEPIWPTDVWGVGCQNTTSTPPDDGYQLLPRFYSDFLSTSYIDRTQTDVPTNFNIKQNYPNPFNPNTTIKYQIPELNFVTLKVYDVLGNEIATLVNEEISIGIYEITFDASNLPSGIYFYRLQAGDFIQTKKMILMK